MSDTFAENTDLVQDHVQSITDRELDLIILKMGSLLSIINNKKTNHAKLLIALVQCEKFRNIFMKVSDIDNFQLVVTTLMEKYPSLCESKVVSGALKSDNKRRKTLI